MWLMRQPSVPVMGAFLWTPLAACSTCWGCCWDLAYGQSIPHCVSWRIDFGVPRNERPPGFCQTMCLQRRTSCPCFRLMPRLAYHETLMIFVMFCGTNQSSAYRQRERPYGAYGISRQMDWNWPDSPTTSKEPWSAYSNSTWIWQDEAVSLESLTGLQKHRDHRW